MESQEQKSFKEKLREKIDEFAHFIYRATKNFPREELYGVISQIRRATLSIVLNYIEGYARRKPAESKYLLEFSLKEDYLNKQDYKIGLSFADEIGAMLWTEISSLEKSLSNKKL